MHDDWTSRMKEWISNSRCLHTLARSLFLTLLLLYRIKKSIWIQIHQIRLRIHGLFEWVKSSRELSTSIQNNLHTSAVKEENAFTWKYSFWCEEKCKKQTTKHSQKKPLKVSAFQHSYVDSAILIHTDDWAEFQWCDNNGFPSPNSYTYELEWIYNFISSKICILSRLVNAFLIPNILQRCWLFHF